MRTGEAGPRVLVATRNAGKLRELHALFAKLGVEVVDLSAVGLGDPSPAEEDLEVHDTFEANALGKAQYFYARSGFPTVADDSGLVVDALGGAPGVRSKRFAGASGPPHEVDAANNARLQSLLAGRTNRRAAFVCAAAYVDGSYELVERGEVHGSITDRPSGADGFGYDPYFSSNELGKTFAEATIAEKETVSHRGRAFRALAAALTLLPGAASITTRNGA